MRDTSAEENTRQFLMTFEFGRNSDDAARAAKHIANFGYRLNGSLSGERFC